MVYRFDIQILRGIAVLLALFYHLEVNWFQNGFLAVDVFFVLSGYLMAQLYNQGTLLDFYKRRTKRLLPAYLVVLSLTIFFVSFVAVAVDANQLYNQLIFNLLGMSNIGLWFHNSYFDATSFKPLLNLWSIGVEIQYYLIVPLLLPLLRRKYLLLLAVILFSLLLTFYVTSISPKTSFYLLPFRIWEFLLGAVAAWSFPSLANKERGLIPSILSVAALLSMMFYPIKVESLNIFNGHPGLAALIISLITVFILIRPLHKIFSNLNIIGRFFIMLGKYSYSIYLVHFPIIIIINYTAFGGTLMGYQSFGGLFLILAITILSSILLYHFVETIQRKKDFLKRFFFILAFSALAIIVGITSNNYRFSQKQHKIFDAWEDRGIYRCGKIFRILNRTKHVCPISQVEGKKSVLLVGNSHADSIKEAFSVSLAKKGLGTYFYVPNEPLMGGFIDSKIIIEDVKRLKLQAVIIHYSPSFFNKEKHLEQLVQVISSLRELNINLYFIAPVPTHSFHVPKRLYENTLSFDKKNKGVNIVNYLKENERFFIFMKENKVDKNLFLTHKEFCLIDYCMIEINGAPLYFDAGHLTLTGAKVLDPVFDDIADHINIKQR